MSTKRSGPPKHQNKYAWKPNAGVKINETEVGGRLRPLSEITGVCFRCKGQIDWKRRYGKYKALSEPAKCQSCTKRAVRQAYHTLCPACAKEQNVCAKCRCHVDRIIGRDLSEVEAEKKMLEEAIRTAREREKRTLIRSMNKLKTDSSEKTSTTNDCKVGDLFPTLSLEEYAKLKAAGVIPGYGAVNVNKKDDSENDDDDDDDDDDGDDSENGSHRTDDDEDDNKDED